MRSRWQRRLRAKVGEGEADGRVWRRESLGASLGAS